MISIIANIISVAIIDSKTVATPGMAAIISPAVSASKIDNINIIISMQHLFFLFLQLS